jgi:hypothetical protein
MRQKSFSRQPDSFVAAQLERVAGSYLMTDGFERSGTTTGAQLC